MVTETKLQDTPVPLTGDTFLQRSKGGFLLLLHNRFIYLNTVEAMVLHF